jgi:hypothetical protein
MNKAFICDIDGTIAHMHNRTPYEWDKVDTDIPDLKVINLVKRLLSTKLQVIFVSGRKEQCRDKTLTWLKKYGLPTDFVFLRADADNRKDSEYKLNVLEAITENWDVQFVLDDRNSVVEMWRNNGLLCLQVAEGNF